MLIHTVLLSFFVIGAPPSGIILEAPFNNVWEGAVIHPITIVSWETSFAFSSTYAKDTCISVSDGRRAPDVKKTQEKV